MDVKEPAFIIGNGTSRLEFDLMSIKDAGTMFGCNALYRDYTNTIPKYVLPHYLVAIDQGITTEIECSDFPSNRVIIPPLEEQWEPAVVNPNRPRSNAGTNAALEAMKMGHNQLIFIGFDFLQENTTQSISNIYDGTDNYGMDTRARPSDNLGRITYMQWIGKQNPDVSFIFAYPNNQFTFPVLGDNIYTCTFDQITSNMETTE